MNISKKLKGGFEVVKKFWNNTKAFRGTAQDKEQPVSKDNPIVGITFKEIDYPALIASDEYKTLLRNPELTVRTGNVGDSFMNKDGEKVFVKQPYIYVGLDMRKDLDEASISWV